MGRVRMINLSVIDWIFFGLILNIIFAIMVVGQRLQARENKNTFLHNLSMGRSLTMPMFVVTNITALFGSFFGVTQFSYERGIYNIITQGIFWYTVYIFAAFVIVPKIRKTSLPQTLPDYLRENYGPVSEKVGALFNFVDILPITFSMGLGILVKSVSGISHSQGILVSLFFVLLYSAFGRYRSSIISDIFQGLIMYISAFLVLFYSFKTHGLNIILTNVPADHWNPFPENFSLTLMWGFFALATLTDPSFYHRCFAAKTTATAQKGIFVSTCFWFLFDIFTTFGAMYARAVMPHGDAQDAYLNYALHILPDPLKGVLLAGIFATMLSAIDTYINIGSITLFKNLIPLNRDDKKRYRYLGMIIISIITGIMANSFDGNIYQIWKTMGSLSTTCLLAPLMVGFFSTRKIGDHGFAFACFLGVFSLFSWKYTNKIGIWAQIDEFYMGLLGSMFGVGCSHLKIIISNAQINIYEIIRKMISIKYRILS